MRERKGKLQGKIYALFSFEIVVFFYPHLFIFFIRCVFYQLHFKPHHEKCSLYHFRSPFLSSLCPIPFLPFTLCLLLIRSVSHILPVSPFILPSISSTILSYLPPSSPDEAGLGRSAAGEGAQRLSLTVGGDRGGRPNLPWRKVTPPSESQAGGTNQTAR